MIAKNPAHIAFASFLSAEKMRFKMFLHLILALIGLHLFTTVVFLLLITQPPQLRISGLWLFSHAMTEINPDYQVIFPDSHGNFRTTVKTVAQSAEVGDYVEDYGLILQRCFYLSAPVYLLLPILLFWFRHRSRKQLQAFHIRGSRLLTAPQLNKLMRSKQESSDLPLGKVTMPCNAENKSVFILGRPGSGKSTALNHVIRKLEGRQAKVLIYDFKGEYLERFYNPDTDIIFNPLDARSVTWNLFAEIRQSTDIDSIASSLIPPAHAHADPFWSDAARQVFTGILHYLHHHNFRTNADIWKMITSDVSTLREALLSVPQSAKATRYLETADADDGSSKQAISILSVMMQYCSAWEYLTDSADGFCLTDWLKQGKGRIFLTSNANISATLKPIHSLFIDLLAKLILSQSDQDETSLFLILDEFGTLQKLPAVVNLLTLGRSKGSSTWLGIQDVGRIDSIYGKDLRQTIVNACGTHLIFGLNDSVTAKYASDLLGEHESFMADKSLSVGNSKHKDSAGISYRRQKNPLLLPSEINQLPDLTGIVRFPNYFPATTQFTYRHFEKQCEHFVIRPDLQMTTNEEETTHEESAS